MAYKKPESMDECIYFSNRELNDGGSAIVWVFKQQCPECKKGMMAKPRDPKTGKPKIRATEYVCSECGHSVEKKLHEESLLAYCEYTCPKCKEIGQAETLYKRKNIDGVPTLRFNCVDCGANIDITKKMKEKKKKK